VAGQRRGGPRGLAPFIRFFDADLSTPVSTLVRTMEERGLARAGAGAGGSLRRGARPVADSRSHNRSDGAPADQHFARWRGRWFGQSTTPSAGVVPTRDRPGRSAAPPARRICLRCRAVPSRPGFRRADYGDAGGVARRSPIHLPGVSSECLETTHMGKAWFAMMARGRRITFPRMLQRSGFPPLHIG
jgi:hypothetical protein